MVIDGAEALGLVAGAVGAFAFAPQAIKILRDNSAEDVSLVTFSMVFAGALLWFGYGLLRGSPAIILWNLIAAGLAGAVIVLKLRLGGR